MNLLYGSPPSPGWNRKTGKRIQPDPPTPTESDPPEETEPSKRKRARDLIKGTQKIVVSLRLNSKSSMSESDRAKLDEIAGGLQAALSLLT